VSNSVIITQSNYLPWKGYFDNIALADELVLYDSVQYTRRDWRNRNRIKTANGLQWLTVPVKVRGHYHQLIEETRIDGKDWSSKHWNAMRHSYGKQPGFETLESLLKGIYQDMRFELLSDLNRCLIEKMMAFLGIGTVVRSSGEFELQGNKTHRLVNICKELGVTRYLTGPAASNYLDESLFHREGMEVFYFDNTYETEYAQPYPPFDHQVSIVDLIACCGERAANYMKNVDKQNKGTVKG